MRKFKFRSWNKKTKKMADVNKLTPLALAIDPSLCGAGIGVYVPDHPDCIIMQFTGRKDRNGKDIYEGDKVFDGVSMLYSVFYDPESCSYVLLNGIDGESFLDYDESTLEVIGNIYATDKDLK